ncbi:MAG: hypothetical protein JOZ27_06140 [Caulobacteraceae bacterium]|nr:hypothetical protein [Caulobacteraceae bacterium]
MIFVTIGSLFPFDRLIRLVDGFAPRFTPEAFFAQIGRGTYEPRNMDFARDLDAGAFQDKLRRCSLMVAHAGMGSVISALEIEKPVVVFPRDYSLGEHTTDHQMATARWLAGKPGVQVCFEETELEERIARVLAGGAAAGSIPREAPAPFLAKIRDFIDGAGQGAGRQ